MAEIKMSYIFIEKEKNESKTMKEILLERVDNVVQMRNKNDFKVDDTVVTYRIIQKENSKRCFLELICKERINRCISALKKVDASFFCSEQQKYYHAIRDYDGISESFCERLYPKYAKFERNLRSLILFILTKAYGSNWQTKTVSKELLKEIKENAHGNVSLNEVLENMDFGKLEDYLFKKRDVDYSSIINEKLSEKCLKELEKVEICAIIEEMRPTSLWERHFEEYGSQEYWKQGITKIHKMRNKVAHQKTISNEEFTIASREVNRFNRDLAHAIEGIRRDNFTEYVAVDILASFGALVENVKINIVESKAFENVLISFNARIQEILQPMEMIYKNSMAKSLKDFENMYRDLNLGMVQVNMIKNMNNIAKVLSYSKRLEDSSAIPQIIDESINKNEVLETFGENIQLKEINGRKMSQYNTNDDDLNEDKV